MTSDGRSSLASRDRLLKVGLYARSGVKEFWIVTPWPWMVEVFVLRGERYEVYGVLGKDQTLISPSFRAHVTSGGISGRSEVRPINGLLGIVRKE
jgi:Uma2 family endonuclease